MIGVRTMCHVGAVALLLCAGGVACAASFVVAASNTTEQAKARADLVCDGTDDQEELNASVPSGSHYSVEWLPGDYYLSGTVVVPPNHNGSIDAEGTYFHYLPDTGDALHVQGMLGSRFRFGTIETTSDGSALLIQNPTSVNALMSIVSFTGLIGHEQKGIGLYIDVSQEGICTDRFEGTDISGFDTGVLLGEGGKKTDTNWFFINSIRRCNTCVREMHVGVDDSVFRLTLDTSLPNSVGIRTEGYAGRFDVMMSDSSGVGTKAVVVEPRGRGNVFLFQPSIDNFAWEELGSPGSNLFLSTTRPPYARASEGSE